MIKHKVGLIYKNRDGEYFESIEKDGQVVLSNPSYPFVFLFEVLRPLELIGTAKNFGHLVEKRNYEFYEGETLTVKVDKKGNLKKVSAK